MQQPAKLQNFGQTFFLRLLNCEKISDAFRQQARFTALCKYNFQAVFDVLKQFLKFKAFCSKFWMISSKFLKINSYVFTSAF
jgi:hypothetical protein